MLDCDDVAVVVSDTVDVANGDADAEKLSETDNVCVDENVAAVVPEVVTDDVVLSVVDIVGDLDVDIVLDADSAEVNEADGDTVQVTVDVGLIVLD